MSASRIVAMVCASTLLAAGPVSAQTNGPTLPPAYATPPAPPAPYDPNAGSYQPIDPGYVAPAQPQQGAVGDTIQIQPAPDGLYNPPYSQPADPGQQPAYPDNAPPPAPAPAPVPAPGQTTASRACGARTVAAQPGQEALARDDVVAAAEGVFGQGAQGLAGLVEKIFKDRGQPNAYIAGREAGGAFVVGVRYGSGIMCHSVEGDKKVFWTGPSVGFDAGADANKVFVLVYNLHDSQELFRRYPTAEGRAYFVGGLAASVLKRGDVVLIPIRLGVGLRLGVNAGYMAFSEKSKILPF